MTKPKSDNKNQHHLDDEQRWSSLMLSAQRGDKTDYQQLLSELSAVIDRYLRSRIGHHHFIEDCVQDSLIAIHKARHTYDAQRLFRPWLFAIVRHKAIDALRHQQAYQRLIDQQINNSLSSVEAGFYQQMENSIISGNLINALTPKHREVITLTKIIGLSTAEAANRLSISQAALKVRVHRAMGRLKKLLESDEL